MHLTEFQKRELLQAMNSNLVRKSLAKANAPQLTLPQRVKLLNKLDAGILPPIYNEKVKLLLFAHIEVLQLSYQATRECEKDYPKPNLYGAIADAYRLRIRKLRELFKKIDHENSN